LVAAADLRAALQEYEREYLRRHQALGASVRPAAKVPWD
jgi:hypothetical protein